MEQRIKKLPLMPLRGIIVFPNMIIHLDVGREKSLAALNAAMVNDSEIILVTQKDSRIEEPTEEDLYQYGTLAEIKQVLKLPGGTIRVLVEGVNRVKIKEYLYNQNYMEVEAELLFENEEMNTELEALMRNVLYQFEQYIKLSKKIPPDTLEVVEQVNEPGRFADLITSHLTLKVERKQEILEAISPKERLFKVIEILSKEIQISEIERKISDRVKTQIEKTQKEYYLREQIKAIQKELGETQKEEVDEYRKKLNSLSINEEIKSKIEKEIDRLEKMSPNAAESTVLRNYLDWVLGLPWNTYTKDRLDIQNAEKILDEDHYGLTKVKERILEFLAVKQLTQNLKSPIICLVGPPGVGKTSLAKSIARALERKFVRISLGGVRDEAEIRGHRRTYVAALPGRIIQGMKNAGSSNPVFLLDEIDKMSMDFRGDPSAALLEVLDPEQNSTFSDHYIELPFDLSKVLFITTANALHPIPRPLLDRMEVIYIEGYTEEEKLAIAKKYLLPKKMTEHGLDVNQFIVTEQALIKVIREYTREAGVRNLERVCATLCRKGAKEIVSRGEKVKITAQNLHTYLGAPKYRWGVREEKDEVGVATGLAWTETGGDILAVEATTMPGTGKLILTGKLGEIMQESARAALSLIRSKTHQLNIDPEFYKNLDIHIHVPEGAIPKDGPSAGITMATSLLSALTNKGISRNVAMTGEITLRGKVLPIGGVKEKVLAAHRAGIKTVILPKDNKKDLEDIPSNIRQKINIKFVEKIEEVWDIAIVGDNYEDNK
ncbi:ATP-dependent proteinase. Serine peptidase. MEROPS family S16 [Anaerobranca californiensis DSM 14826]|uniref:Lon protease n=1 Tax=Anaerobranca californiensis DSM 14826 TaxID=1120989 RepID=A0A1M6P8L4_9FIRM|nr:endopeptidase La [Anaerobranca californiensis]SHK04297.1 ATP-dependent proteinase. Serine peptidase. MEROPS family S16 [Anaerobranca californiensis DSM 14826]